jgi:hypothetical protein
LKSTLDYYAIFGTTAKIHFIGAPIVRRKTNREWMFRLERRKKLHCSYPGKLEVLTPFNQRCEHFVENYDSRDERRAWEMSRQARMIRADYTANFKDHSRSVALDWTTQSE